MISIQSSKAATICFNFFQDTSALKIPSALKVQISLGQFTVANSTCLVHEVFTLRSTVLPSSFQMGAIIDLNEEAIH